MGIKGIALSAALSFGLAAIASPAMATVTTWDGSGANATVDFSQYGNGFTPVASGSSFTTSTSLTGTFTTSDGSSAYAGTNGSDWAGNFANGAPILYNGAAFSGSNPDLIFNFSAPVMAVGAQLQTNEYGPYSELITLSDGSTFTNEGVASGADDNTAAFIGVISSAADISSVTFRATDQFGDVDFAMGNISLETAPPAAAAAPEPATWMMMILGFGLVGGVMRRAYRKSEENFTAKVRSLATA